jgi:hypothetical protein
MTASSHNGDALTEAWLQELWPTCRELSKGERAEQRDQGKARMRWLEERTVCPPDEAVA